MHQNLLVDPIICNSGNFYTHSLLRTTAGKSDEGYSGVSMSVTIQDGYSCVKLNPYNHKLHKDNLVVKIMAGSNYRTLTMCLLPQLIITSTVLIYHSQ